MDNIQLYHIDNEINKVDEMKEGDVIYKNGVELLVVLSYDHNEPCKGCFFYEDKACVSERLIKCWDCKKEFFLLDEELESFKEFLNDSTKNIYHSIDGVKIVKSENGGLCGVGRIPHRLRTL